MTYEYECGACSHQWEMEQSIKDAPARKCPRCRKLQARRQISAGTGFILKGGGWYSDGYGSARKSTGDSGADKPAADKKETAEKPADKKAGTSSSTDSTAAA